MTTCQTTTLARRLQATLSQASLTSIGRDTGFTKRLREVTPVRLVVSLITAMATQRVETLADLLRAFNAMTGRSVQYKPFHNQLAKAAFPDFMKAVFEHLLGELTLRVLAPLPGTCLRQFEDVVIQDGSSFALKDVLANHFPGRFTAIKPAAVELHATASLFRDQVLHVSLAPDARGERDFLPPADSLRGKLILGDRGYTSLSYCRAVEIAGGHYLIRFRKDVNPWVLECRVNGQRWRKLEGRRLHDVLRSLRGRSADLEVEARRAGVQGYSQRFRMVMPWNPETQEHMFLATNLDAASFDETVVRSLYRLRWQVELVFKEWKSYANLHVFGTGKPGIAEGLIWASLSAALLKRYLAHAAQLALGRVEISTRRVAMCLAFHLQPLMKSLLLGFRSIEQPFEQLLTFLKANAQRAHPKRDRARGRLRDGLRPLTMDAALRFCPVKN